MKYFTFLFTLLALPIAHARRDLPRIHARSPYIIPPPTCLHYLSLPFFRRSKVAPQPFTPRHSPDDQAFLTALYEDPSDRLRSAVYGDFLDDKNEPVLARAFRSEGPPESRDLAGVENDFLSRLWQIDPQIKGKYCYLGLRGETHWELGTMPEQFVRFGREIVHTLPELRDLYVMGHFRFREYGATPYLQSSPAQWRNLMRTDALAHFETISLLVERAPSGALGASYGRERDQRVREIRRRWIPNLLRGLQMRRVPLSAWALDLDFGLSLYNLEPLIGNAVERGALSIAAHFPNLRKLTATIGSSLRFFAAANSQEFSHRFRSLSDLTLYEYSPQNYAAAPGESGWSERVIALFPNLRRLRIIEFLRYQFAPETFQTIYRDPHFFEMELIELPYAISTGEIDEILELAVDKTPPTLRLNRPIPRNENAWGRWQTSVARYRERFGPTSLTFANDNPVQFH